MAFPTIDTANERRNQSKTSDSGLGDVPGLTCVVGDLVIAVIAKDPVAGSVTFDVIPGGTGTVSAWTVEKDVTSGSGTSGIRLAVGWAVCTSAGTVQPSAYYSTTVAKSFTTFRVTGADTTTPIQSSASSATAAPALTPVAGTDVVALSVVGDEAPNLTAATSGVSGQAGFSSVTAYSSTYGTTGGGSASNISHAWAAWGKNAATSASVTPSITTGTGTKVWIGLLIQAATTPATAPNPRPIRMVTQQSRIRAALY